MVVDVRGVGANDSKVKKVLRLKSVRHQGRKMPCGYILFAEVHVSSEMAEHHHAKEIPNLLSLRGSGGGRRRGGSPLFNHGRTQEDAETRKDRIVQQTDNDASGSRVSAVSLGYLDDPFAQAFLQGPVPRRYPIINRGIYSFLARIEAPINPHRNIYSHRRNRPSRQCLSLHRSRIFKADNIPRRRLRYTILSHRHGKPHHRPNLPRA